ncbi:MAG: tRNA epoxyqueuosine(34) reductase QueG [Alphaproteobacteria bacterium]|nr:tRNA epoxyqueuosine(34) reductase QueG [Alphaproteobacteria bacterium]
MTTTLPATDIRAELRDRALALGFDAVGFAAARAAPEAKAGLAEFLARGHQGDMGWLARNAERRGDPAALWPAARTVVVVAANYGPGDDPLAALAWPDRGTISCYAQGGRDYHDVLMGRLKQLAGWTQATWGGEVKLFTDTAPVMEKPLARQAGLGWQGKHTNLVSRQFGSWLFLGEMFTTLDIPADMPEADHCGSCRACLDVCPTNAFPAPYRLDARRCISYLTIEHKGVIAREFRQAMGNRIYGCDDCLAVCPWNKFARRTEEPDFLPRARLTAPRLADLAALDDAGFRNAFAGTAIKRTGRDRFVRNVLIAIANSADPALAAVAEARLGDGSALVRGMAVWALSRLAPRAHFEALSARHLGHETDAAVRAEWTEGMCR